MMDDISQEYEYILRKAAVRWTSFDACLEHKIRITVPS